jgi:hypothetical protein
MTQTRRQKSFYAEIIYQHKGGDQNDVVGHKNQDPKKCEIILFFK